MTATASAMLIFLGSTTAALLPSRWMWMRSATSKTCGMLCEMRMTGRPRSRMLWISLRT